MSSLIPSLMAVLEQQLSPSEIAFSMARAHLRFRNNPPSILSSMRRLLQVLVDHNEDNSMDAQISQLTNIIRLAEAIMHAKSAAELNTHERELYLLWQRATAVGGYRSILTALKKTVQLCGYMHLTFVKHECDAENQIAETCPMPTAA